MDQIIIRILKGKFVNGKIIKTIDSKINEFIQVIYLNQKSKSYYKKYFYSFINLSYNSILILFSLCNLIIASISNSL
jgi:hypothetical protein